MSADRYNHAEAVRRAKSLGARLNTAAQMAIELIAAADLDETNADRVVLSATVGNPEPKIVPLTLKDKVLRAAELAYSLAGDLHLRGRDPGDLAFVRGVQRNIEFVLVDARGLLDMTADYRAELIAVQLQKARNLAAELAVVLEASSESSHMDERRSGQGEQIRMSAPALGAARAAAWLLAAADRDRYAEEFKAELLAIASAGGRCREQLACALAQLRRAPLLRVELREPRRRNAAP